MTYNRIKDEIYSVNHTDRPHNHLKFPCDVEHTVNEKREIPGSLTNVLVAAERPSWAKKRYYFLTALLGLSSRMRDQVYANSKGVTFNVVKQINEIEADKTLAQRRQQQSAGF